MLRIGNKDGTCSRCKHFCIKQFEFPTPFCNRYCRGVVRFMCCNDFEPKEKEMKENVNHPSHYNFGKYEVIDVIDDWKLGFSLGNAVKYIARAGKKDPAKEVEDLKKAVFYINHEIERLSEVEG